jgi:hypothetical protein
MAVKQSGSLTEAMKAIATGYSRTKPAKPSVKVDASLTEAMQDVASRPSRKPASTRAGRKGIVIYVDQDVAAGIHRISASFNATVQDLGVIAFKHLFEKFDEPWPDT